MKLTTVKEIYKEREKYLDKEVTVGGWVRSVRDSKTFGFIVLHDGSFFETLQVVYHDTMENFAEISKLNVGAAIIVKGTLVATPQAKQPVHLHCADLYILRNTRKILPSSIPSISINLCLPNISTICASSSLLPCASISTRSSQLFLTQPVTPRELAI